MLKTALIIPVYNEELTIKNTLLDFCDHLPDASFFVIDNNSTDATYRIAREVYREKNLKGEILFEKNQGKGNAVRKAFSEVVADVYIIVDGDQTYKGKDVSNLMKPILDADADMTVGDRHKTGAYKSETKRLFHKFGNTLVRRLINLLFNSNLDDILSGYRCFNRKFIENFPILSGGFELETEMTLHSLDKRFRIVEVPIEYKERPEGSYSKINTFKDGIKIVRTIYQIFRYYKPLVFFALVSGILFILGLMAGIPVILEYIHNRFIEHVPLSILATGLMILSILAITIGFILDAIVRIHKFDYELHMIRRNN